MISSARSLLTVAGLLTALAGAVLLAQNPPPPPPPPPPAPPAPQIRVTPGTRDTPLLPVYGTSVLAGTVSVAEVGGRSVRRAIVTVNGAELRGTRMTVTDDEGHFVFADLPAGRFTLNVTRPGFLSSYYGARKPWRGPGTPIALAAGQRVTDIDLKIVRGAVVTGTLLDPNGQPQANLRVQVMENRLVSGQPTLQPVSTGGGGGTDDRGIYRIFGLAPGTYLLGATGTPMSPTARLTTETDVQWALQQAAARGITASPGSAPEPGPVLGYSPVYYPGSIDPSGAVAVTLAVGEERAGLDLAMQFVPTARVEGTIVGADGQPAAGVQLYVLPLGRTTGLNVFDGSFGSRATSDRTGRFSVMGVRPGQYTVTARGPSRPQMPQGAPGPNGQMPPTGPTGADLWAQTEITVAGRDLTGVTLMLQPGMTVSGRLAFEGTRLQPPTDFARVQVSMRPPPNQMTPSPDVPASQVTPNGAFTVAGVAPGRYVLASSVPPAPGAPPGMGWAVKSISVKGQDVLESSFEIQPNEHVGEVVITFTDQITEISGRLIDTADRPAAGYYVLVFPANTSYWYSGSRRLRPPTRSGPDGRFRITGLPPGEYFIAALTEFESQDLYDSSFLEQVAPASLKITLAEGEKKVQDMKLAGGL